jgi:hypothetical protein
MSVAPNNNLHPPPTTFSLGIRSSRRINFSFLRFCRRLADSPAGAFSLFIGLLTSVVYYQYLCQELRRLNQKQNSILVSPLTSIGYNVKDFGKKPNSSQSRGIQ